MSLWIDFLVMVVVALITMAVMGVIFKYLDKCVRSIKKTGKKVTFSCIVTVAMWVAIAFIIDVVAC